MHQTMQKYKRSLYAKKIDNLEKMNGQIFQESSTSFNSRLNQEEIVIMNKTIRNTEVETVIKNFPQDKSPSPDGFTGEFHKTLRQELVSILPNSS